jgi:ABC-type Fe3+ transport system permease subunit
VAIRSIILAPYLIANVIAAIIWFWMLDPLLGFGNVVLQAVGAGRIAFFSDQHLALPTIAAVNIWRHMGLVAILFYTGIQTIPQDIYEAARIEGAGPWKNFSRITLPLLRPTLVFVLITSIIGSFQVFDSIAVTTLGGPVNSTRTIVWYIYESAFQNFRMGLRIGDVLRTVCLSCSRNAYADENSKFGQIGIGMKATAESFRVHPSPGRWIGYAILGAFAIVSLGPIWIAVKTALSDSRTLFSGAGSFLPTDLTLFNIQRVLGLACE